MSRKWIGRKMDKKSPFFTATVASITYLVILLMLEYFLPITKEIADFNIDWPRTLGGAIAFWIVIFIVHQFLKRRYS